MQTLQTLAKQIANELKAAKHCAVYENDLMYVWPVRDQQREAKIAQFAKEHGWRLIFYREELCAIFNKVPTRSRSAKSTPSPEQRDSLGNFTDCSGPFGARTSAFETERSVSVGSQ